MTTSGSQVCRGYRWMIWNRRQRKRLKRLFGESTLASRLT